MKWISIWKELNEFIKEEWNPRFYDSDLKFDSLFNRLPLSMLYLEKAHYANKKETNAIIALIVVTHALSDTVRLKNI